MKWSTAGFVINSTASMNTAITSVCARALAASVLPLSPPAPHCTTQVAQNFVIINGSNVVAGHVTVLPTDAAGTVKRVPVTEARAPSCAPPPKLV